MWLQVRPWRFWGLLAAENRRACSLRRACACLRMVPRSSMERALRGRVVHVLENAEMQQENWRDADLFFERCRTLREMLRGIVAKGEVAHA